MKYFFLIFPIFFIAQLKSQTASPPDFINYQAVLRDANGVELEPGTNVLLGVRIFTLQTDGSPVYEESHSVTVPSSKVINLKMGKGIASFGTFSSIKWETGSVHYQILLNGTPIGGKIPFASVPYALYSPKSNVNISQAPGSITTVSPNNSSSSYTLNTPAPTFSNLGTSIGTISAGTYPNYFVDIPHPVFQNIGIGTLSGSWPTLNLNVPQPLISGQGLVDITLSSYPNYYISVPTPTLTYNSSSGLFSLSQGTFLTSSNLSPSLSLLGNNLSVAASTLNIPQLGYWFKPSASVVSLGNASDNVGIGTSNPTSKLQIESNTADVAIVSSPLNPASLSFGSGTLTALGRILYDNSTHVMSFQTNSVPNRLLINNLGNVGINNPSPGERLHVVGNAKATNFLYNSPKTRYYNMGEADFNAALTATASGEVHRSFSAGGVGIINATAPNALVAPIHIPHGSTVTSVQIFYVDERAAGDMVIEFQRRNNTGGLSSIASGTTSGSTAGVQTMTLTIGPPHTVDNFNWNYLIRVYSTNWSNNSTKDMYIYAVRVNYVIIETD